MANKVMVYAEDMTDDMMNKAIEVGKQAFVKAVIDKPTDQVRASSFFLLPCLSASVVSCFSLFAP